MLAGFVNDISSGSILATLATTANAFSDDVSAALASGMNAHVSKPLDIVQLCKTLSEWIGRGD